MRVLLSISGKILSALICLLPKKIRDFLGDAFGWLWFDILRVRRQLVLDNLKIAFPDMSLDDRIKLGRKSMEYMGRNLFEYARFPFLTHENYNKYVIVEGEEHLKQALAKEKGVCLMSAHLGNGDFSLAGFSLSGYAPILISKLIKWKALNDVWFGLRSRMGTEFIPPRNSTMQIIKSLRNNRIVIFVQDQFMGPPIGCRVEFFGRTTGSAMGLALIAQRTESPILPFFAKRLEDGKHLIRVYPEILMEHQGSKEETARLMTQKFTEIIEHQIRQDPAQWMWVHNRWKTFKGDTIRSKRHGEPEGANAEL